jgi:hypothetical protein
MHDEDIPDPATAYDRAEREVVYLLTDPEHYQPIWSAQDMARELEITDPAMVIRPLVRAGLVNETSDGHLFATHAAARMVALVGHIV